MIQSKNSPDILQSTVIVGAPHERRPHINFGLSLSRNDVVELSEADFEIISYSHATEITVTGLITCEQMRVTTNRRVMEYVRYD